MHPSPRSGSLLIAACGLLALLVTACSTVGSRIGDQQAKFDSYPAAVQQQIRAGQINIGFTPDMVQMALGKPDDIYTSTTSQGQATVWGYRDDSPLLGFSLGIGSFGGGVGGGIGVGTSTGGNNRDKVRVVFENGRVGSVEKTLKGN